ncbi:MAG: hypothetical protein V4793_36140, partial [Paraburkholderia tropica]
MRAGALEHRKREIGAEHRRFGEALAQIREVVTGAAAQVEHARGAHLDVVEALAHAARDFSRQERDLVESRRATIENPLHMARIIGRTAGSGVRRGHVGRIGEVCEVYSLTPILSVHEPATGR